MQCGALVVDACRFLPQSRPRVFVIAVDARVDCSEFLTDGDSPWFTKAVKKAHAMIPESRKGLWRWWDLPEPNETVPCAYDMIEAEPTNVEWHDQDETGRLFDMMSDLHRSKVKEAVRLGKPVGFLYKRIRKGVQRAEVRFDGVAGCLRTPHGGSSRQTVLVVNGSDLASRLLSPREAARLMGVPDSFWLPPRYNDAYRAIGDGVAVPVVSWLSSRLLAPLAQLCRKSDVGAQPAVSGDQDRAMTSESTYGETMPSLEGWWAELNPPGQDPQTYAMSAGLIVLEGMRQSFPLTRDPLRDRRESIEVLWLENSKYPGEARRGKELHQGGRQNYKRCSPRCRKPR